MGEDVSETAGEASNPKALGITVLLAGVRVGRRTLMQCFAVYVAGNMMVCAILFAPWVHPRETVSGLMGRWLATEGGWKRRIAAIGVRIVDRLYFWEPNHCAEIYLIEQRAREVLYP